MSSWLDKATFSTRCCVALHRARKPKPAPLETIKPATHIDSLASAERAITALRQWINRLELDNATRVAERGQAWAANEQLQAEIEKLKQKAG